MLLSRKCQHNIPTTYIILFVKFQRALSIWRLTSTSSKCKCIFFIEPERDDESIYTLLLYMLKGDRKAFRTGKNTHRKFREHPVQIQPRFASSTPRLGIKLCWALNHLTIKLLKMTVVLLIEIRIGCNFLIHIIGNNFLSVNMFLFVNAR